MRPFLTGQSVQISDVSSLEFQLRDPTTVAFGRGHLSEAGNEAVVDHVYTVTRENRRYFFYALRGSSLLWPHAAFITRGRVLTVNEARPQENRPQRKDYQRVSQDAPDRPNSISPAPAVAGAVRLFIGNLPYKTSDLDILRLFTKFGDVAKATVIMDCERGVSKGFGFVEFGDDDAAQVAIDALNGCEMTSTGEVLDQEYHSWLQQSLHIHPVGLLDHDDGAESAARVILILEESSRRLAECIADYPVALNKIEWRDFERMLAAVFEGLGFQVFCGRGSKDGGVDLCIKTGSTTYVVQAKHWVSGKRVPGSALKATVTIALREGHTGAIVLSTSNFARNAATAITSIERRILRIGQREEIHSLCRTYVGVRRGLLHPLDPDAVVRTHTRPM